MTIFFRLCLLVTCFLLPLSCLVEKKTDHRLIYQSEDIIRQQDAEEGRLLNATGTGPGSENEQPEVQGGDLSEENAIEYLPEPKKVPKFGETDIGELTETVIVHVPEGLPEICSLPKIVGKCRARKRRYYFNTKTMECERFVYGGCKGNANRFFSLEECDQTCHPAF